MRYVLDTNVFVLAFGSAPPVKTEDLLALVVERAEDCELITGREILTEVRRNLTPEALRRCWELLRALAVVPVEDWQIPFDLGEKYREPGLKAGDAAIAALTEWAEADYLVTENRDFMDRSLLPFRVVRIAEFLTVLRQKA
ncbi:MAG: type II toxin-antitoxin system VapC family toxin [Candidatus Coatesbacteria bacterium]